MPPVLSLENEDVFVANGGDMSANDDFDRRIMDDLDGGGVLLLPDLDLLMPPCGLVLLVVVRLVWL